MPSVANCLTARMFKGFNSTLTDGQTPIVTTGGVFVDAIPFDTTQITSAENGSNPKVGDPCHPLAAGAHAPAIAIQGNLIGRDVGGPQGVGASDDGVMYTLTKADVHGVAQPMAFQQNTRDEVRYISGDGQIAGALAAESGMKQTNYIAQPIGAKDNGMGVAMPFRDPCPTLTSKMQGSSGWAPQNEDAHLVGVGPTMQVRRLTPRECERLQGFPDDYTLIPWRGKEAPDGPRYKALGNSMAVPVMAWIGQRIAQVAAISAEQAAA